MAKKIKKIFKNTTGILSKVLGGGSGKKDNQAEELAKQQQAAAQAAKDASTDLRNTEVAEVNPAAGADNDSDAYEEFRKKRQGSSLSSALGLRV